jgi:phosphatidylglycerol:prolipoprotein diacylglycerol transferase
MLAAVAAGVLVSRRTQTSLSLGRLERLGIALGAFCGGMIGAKLPFVFSDWNGLLTGAAWWSDGKTILFGLVGGYFGVELAKWTLDIRKKTGDTFAVPVAVAVGIGRFGCLTAGCCYGTPTDSPLGIDFGDGVPRHPTQLYEAAFHLAAAVVLSSLLARGHFRGQLIKIYFMAYFTFRFLTEFIRPEPRLWLDLTGYQWAALGLLPLFALLWFQDARLTTSNADQAAGFGNRPATLQ